MVEISRELIASVTDRVRGTVRSESRGLYHELTFRAMSTPVRICFLHEQPALAMELQHTIVEWISAFEARYSRFIPQSIVGQINANSGGDWLEVDAETDELLGLCDQMHAFTRGVFDAASLPMMRLWDWKSKPSVLPDPKQSAAVRETCGWEKINRRPRAIRLPGRDMGIDLGGIGKEYAVDRVVTMARERGTKDLLVDIGQDVRVCGHAPQKDAWYIGLEEPDHPGNCWNCLRLTDHAVATSGDYLRSFTIGDRRYGHIVDPRTGEPVSNGCQAVTVVAPTCTMAGVLSTAAFILGPKDGLELIQSHGNADGCITTESARHQTRRFSRHVPI